MLASVRHGPLIGACARVTNPSSGPRSNSTSDPSPVPSSATEASRPRGEPSSPRRKRSRSRRSQVTAQLTRADWGVKHITPHPRGQQTTATHQPHQHNLHTATTQPKPANQPRPRALHEPMWVIHPTTINSPARRRPSQAALKPQRPAADEPSIEVGDLAQRGNRGERGKQGNPGNPGNLTKHRTPSPTLPTKHTPRGHLPSKTTPTAHPLNVSVLPSDKLSLRSQCLSASAVVRALLLSVPLRIPASPRRSPLLPIFLLKQSLHPFSVPRCLGGCSLFFAPSRLRANPLTPSCQQASRTAPANKTPM